MYEAVGKGNKEETMKSGTRHVGIGVLTGLLLLTLGWSTAWAQVTAQINGTVKDQSGAVLPGVEVTVTQTDTGLKRSIPSNENGSFVLQDLPLGPYRLEA